MCVLTAYSGFALDEAECPAESGFCQCKEGYKLDVRTCRRREFFFHPSLHRLFINNSTVSIIRVFTMCDIFFHLTENIVVCHVSSIWIQDSHCKVNKLAFYFKQKYNTFYLIRVVTYNDHVWSPLKMVMFEL